MGDVAIKDDEQPDRLAEARLALQAGLRGAVTGDAVRGNLRLYVLMAVLGVCVATAPFPANGIGLVALVLLILDGGR